MLNEAMDQVVLVKGWKKGANWSFPRGKINKDEDDLDCAVREVYEETGYDIKGAGLVKDEQETKYIEVNMREQNMRLYVFRAVPMDTHFEPKTRKEISKIDWYKLTDLPTAKKHKHQETLNASVPTNANKFYMVAPFLVPLKKWIAQQRKRDNRRSSQAHLAPPAIFEETVTEDEPDLTNGEEHPPLQPVVSYGPSDLPEVSVAQPYEHDPSAQLKQLLNVNDGMPPLQETNYQPAISPKSDELKASALLALLRHGSTVHPEPPPQTPMDRLSFLQEVPRPPHHAHARAPAFAPTQPPPQFPIKPDSNHSSQSHFLANQPAYSLQGDQGYFGQRQTVGEPDSHSAKPTWSHQQQPSAPYRQTGDPQFARQSMQNQQLSSVPPASALPKLTNHTRALLDVFKTGPVAQIPQAPTQPEHQSYPTPSLEALAPSPAKTVYSSMPAIQQENTHTMSTKRAKSEHQTSLLNLFRKTQLAEEGAGTSPQTLSVPPAPVELSAQRTPGLDEKTVIPHDHFKHSLQHENEEAQGPRDHRKSGRQRKREGQTSATVSGPINQPEFENIAHTPRRTAVPNEFTRSPKPTARTLFDPNQPAAVKILARLEETKHSPARSPNALKSTPDTEPKPMPRTTDPTKSFQPQILRRPQTEDLLENQQVEYHEMPPKLQAHAKQSPVLPTNVLPTKPPMPQRHHLRPSGYPLPSKPVVPDVQQSTLLAPTESIEPLASKPSLSSRPSVPNDPHRQSLLSLFNKPSAPSGTVSISLQPPRTESPLSASQVVSPVNEKQANGVATISTRSRMGSIASVVSGTSQAPPEKRQTTAGDRAFLLGYLGRIASQEG